MRMGAISDQLEARLTWRGLTERAQAESAIRDAYAASGLVEPERIVWIAGPKDARQILARLGWRRWIPWAALACSLATMFVGAADEQGAAQAGLDALSLPWNEALALSWSSALAVVSMGLFLGVLAMEWLRCASLRAIHIGLIAGAILVSIAALVGFSLHQALTTPHLLNGFLAVPTLAVIIARWRDNPVHSPHRTGPALNRSIARMMRRALSHPERSPERGPEPEAEWGRGSLASFIAPPRGYAWVELIRTLAPMGLCPVEIMLRSRTAMLGAPTETLYRSPLAERAAVALALHVDMLWAFKKIALVLAPPEKVVVDEQVRLHNASGPAVRWADGCEVFAVDGELATDLTIMLEPDRLSLDQIRQEPNPSLRRALIEKFGVECLMKRLGGWKSAEDSAGELWRARDFDGEPLVMVRVVNTTPELDGSHRIYWLRVPPTIFTAHEGVAWTFGLNSKIYQPGRES